MPYLRQIFTYVYKKAPSDLEVEGLKNEEVYFWQKSLNISKNAFFQFIKRQKQLRLWISFAISLMIIIILYYTYILLISCLL